MSSLPRTILFIEEEGKLPSPVGTAVPPEMEDEEEQIARKRPQIGNVEANLFVGNEELERSVRKQRNSKVISGAANGGLKDQANRARIKAELASSKSNHKSKEGVLARNREAQAMSNFFLNFFPRSERKTRQLHGQQRAKAQELLKN